MYREIEKKSHFGKKDSNGGRNAGLQNVESGMSFIPFLILWSFCVHVPSFYHEPNMPTIRLRRETKSYLSPRSSRREERKVIPFLYSVK